MKLNKYICLWAMVCASCCFLAGCADELNENEKQTGAEASNKVFVSEEYASLDFDLYRTMEGEITNMDTLVTKVVFNCSSPAGNDLTVKIALDTLLVDVYNKKNETAYRQLQANWIKLSKTSLTISEGKTESDTLTVTLTKPLKGSTFSNMNGYMMPIRITSASGYDAQVDYEKRISYLKMNVTQENAVGFIEGEKNTMTIAGNAEFAGCDLSLMAYIAPINDVKVELEIDNDLVADFNSNYGTDFKTLPANELTLPTAVLPAGSKNFAAHLSYTGDASTLDANYLVPIKVKSVTPTDNNAVGIAGTDLYYVIVNFALGWSFVTEAADISALGIRQEDRSGYSVISAEETAFMTPNDWNSMFSGGQWVTNNYPRSITVDLGKEMQNITGIYMRAANMQMAPIDINISYSNEKLAADYPTINYSLGTLPFKRPGQDYYFKFATPITTRYIGLNNMVGLNNGFYSFIQFYIYTQQ